jgi:hypothetical protein
MPLSKQNPGLADVFRAGVNPVGWRDGCSMRIGPAFGDNRRTFTLSKARAAVEQRGRRFVT